MPGRGGWGSKRGEKGRERGGEIWGVWKLVMGCDDICMYHV